MMDPLGQTIGSYQIIEVIDRGGDTDIYKGYQPAMNRYVAVKMLGAWLTENPTIVQQFQRDVTQMAQLAHRNILPIYDAGQFEQNPYMVTQFVETGPLSDHMMRFHAVDRAETLVTGIASALDYIHGQGITHGALKPTNIFLDDQLQPLLADVGFSPRPGVTITPYMSPEQRQGAAIDSRTDIYALGAILYEMVIGTPPATDSVPTPRVYRPDLPTEVEKVILKAMAWNPDQRFQTAGELSSALARATASPQIESTAPPVVVVEASVPAQPQTVVVTETSPSETTVAAGEANVSEKPSGSSDIWIYIIVAIAIVLAIIALFLLFA